MAIDISIRIGGQAGQGMQSIGQILGKIFTRQGLYVFLHQDIESRIRGGHSYVQLRIKDEPCHAFRDKIELLIAFSEGSIEHDRPDLTEGGLMVYDGEATGFTSQNSRHLSIPMETLAQEAGKKKIMANTVATGAVLALLGCDLQPLLDRLEEEFRAKGKETIEKNKNCASSGYRFVQSHHKGAISKKTITLAQKKNMMLMTGSQAMALGAICSGLKFYSGYPMSPSTPIMEYIASLGKEFGIVVEPAEDEIAAINMVLGASFAGVRSMTATSGGGFCLMVEGLGLAGMTETPAVIIVAQRAGPSTGLPTRTEQADLSFVIHASHGEFPRAVFAPGNAEQAFYTMAKALNIADRYQTPVIVLGDQHLNDSFFTVEHLDSGRNPIDRGMLIPHGNSSPSQDYQRYAWDDSGVSPRILPGHPGAVVYADSDEHTEAGHITESAEVRAKMMTKRMTKLTGILGSMALPEVYCQKDPHIVLIGWGSTHGALKESVDILNRDGHKAAMIHFCDIFPFAAADLNLRFTKTTKILSVENNYTSQFAGLFTKETGIPITHHIVKYDGRPFSPQEIATQVKNHL
jgi:2-oxoglutarate ferredoxin oxidoreductase subunit alpha